MSHKIEVDVLLFGGPYDGFADTMTWKLLEEMPDLLAVKYCENCQREHLHLVITVGLIQKDTPIYLRAPTLDEDGVYAYQWIGEFDPDDAIEEILGEALPTVPVTIDGSERQLVLARGL